MATQAHGLTGNTETSAAGTTSGYCQQAVISALIITCTGRCTSWAVIRPACHCRASRRASCVDYPTFYHMSGILDPSIGKTQTT